MQNKWRRTEENNSNHHVSGFAPHYLLYGTSDPIFRKELNSDWIKDMKIALENAIKSH